MTFDIFNAFAADEEGAVTVDWVVLTAALVGLGLAVISVVSNGMEDLSEDLSTSLSDTDPNEDPFATNTFSAATPTP